MAYYWLFAIVPLTALGLGLAATVFSVGDIAEWVMNALDQREPTVENSQLAASIETLLTGTEGSTFNVVAAVLAAVSVSFAFAATQDGLNMVWDYPKRHGAAATLRRRVILFVVTIAAASLFVVVLLAAAIVETVKNELPVGLLEDTPGLVTVAGVVIVAYGLVVFAYRYLPNRMVPWRPALIAGAVAVLCLVLVTVGYDVYLNLSSQASLAGAVGAVFTTLVWLYLLAQVFLGGAELSRAIDDRRTDTNG